MGHDPPARVRALIAVYRSTHYDATLPGGAIATLRVDAAAPMALLEWIGADRQAWFLTACNPRSEILPEAENGRRLDQLRERLRLRRCRILEGVGYVPGGSWREPSLLVAGIDSGAIDALAREFGQNATVVVAPVGPVRLRIHRTDWRSMVDAADLEWCDA